MLEIMTLLFGAVAVYFGYNKIRDRMTIKKLEEQENNRLAAQSEMIQEQIKRINEAAKKSIVNNPVNIKERKDFE